MTLAALDSAPFDGSLAAGILYYEAVQAVV
eukprot:COSAG06_NODE_5354_length_3530_cov_4.602448_4_plen_30_part_00